MKHNPVFVTSTDGFPCLGSRSMDHITRLARQGRAAHAAAVTRAGEVLTRKVVMCRVDARNLDGEVVREAWEYSLVDAVTGTVYDMNGRCWSSDQLKLLVRPKQ